MHSSECRFVHGSWFTFLDVELVHSSEDIYLCYILVLVDSVLNGDPIEDS